jgi:protease I
MTNDLKGKRVAILVADGFEQVEMTEPRKALKDAGAITEIVWVWLLWNDAPIGRI